MKKDKEPGETTSKKSSDQVQSYLMPTILAGGVYIVLAELLLQVRKLTFPLAISGLHPADTLSLLTGAVTAAALSSVYLQVKGARSDAAKRAAEEAAQAALRADELHAQFHTYEMSRQRAIAIQFLRHLLEKELIDRYAEIWVGDSRDEIWAPVRDLNGGPLTYHEQSWALEVVIAFFVRVGAHLSLYEDHLPTGTERARNVLAPFCWSYWRDAGLLEFAHACERFARAQCYERPYFIDQLRRVDSATSVPGTTERSTGATSVRTRPATSRAASTPATPTPSSHALRASRDVARDALAQRR